MHICSIPLLKILSKVESPTSNFQVNIEFWNMIILEVHSLCNIGRLKALTSPLDFLWSTLYFTTFRNLTPFLSQDLSKAGITLLEKYIHRILCTLSFILWVKLCFSRYYLTPFMKWLVFQNISTEFVS